MTDFLDTNILVYAYDSNDQGKQQIARQLLENAIIEENAAISAQVLGEFFVVVTRKIAVPLTSEEAGQLLAIFRKLPVIEIDGELVDSAVDIHQRYGVSYWDGLIIAAARQHGCNRVLSEDLQAGQKIDGVEIVNPFVQ